MMDKLEYIRGLLKGREYSCQLMQAALVFWHSQIPFYEATVYLTTLEKKLESVNSRSNNRGMRRGNSGDNQD